MNHDRSRALYDRALDVLPGGVNSPVRATRPYPAFIDHGDGGHVVDADGNRYVDHVMGYGPLLLGHDLPEPVMAAVQSAASDGPMYGAPTELEVELAEFLTRHVPSVDRVRFVNSGTEATVSALRLARAHTGRDDVVVVQGGYHGAQESTLVEGDLTGTTPSSPGIPQAFAEHTIPVPFNDLSALQSAFEVSGSHDGGPAAGWSGSGAGDTDVAAVILEPILGNNGIVHPTEGYLERVRELCTEHGALLIFDEVITGFRVGGLGCAQSRFDVTPDLTTFGKVIGGGFPVGAIGGRGPIVDQFTPSGDVFQAGTFSGHPVTMAAGLATLEYAAAQDVYDHLAELGQTLRAGLTDILADQAPEYTVVGSDSMFKVIFTGDGPDELEGQCEAGCRQDPSCPRYDYCPKDGADVDAAAGERWERLFRPAMLDAGVMLTGNQNESQFLCYQHTAADVETTLEAYKTAL